jgi:hypothetical protein
MSKTVLGQNGEKIFQKSRLGTKCRILVYVVFDCFFFHLKPKKVLLNDSILNIIGIIKSVNPNFHKKTSFMQFIISECLTIFFIF